MAVKQHLGRLVWLLLFALPHISTAQEVPLEVFLNDLRKQFGVHLVYSKTFLPDEAQLDQLPANASLTECLDQLAKKFPLEYTLRSNTVWIRAKSGNRFVKENKGVSKKLPRNDTFDSPYGYPQLDIPERKVPTELYLGKLNPQPLRLEFRAVAAAEAPGGQEPSQPQIHPVRLGPIYVHPRQQYAFLDRIEASLNSDTEAMPLPKTVAYYGSHEDEVLYKYRLFNLSVVPGLGTNGINPGTYYNGVSLNLTVDYSAGNNIVGVSGFSNFSKYSAYGIQVAGVLNVVGGDLRQHKRYSRMELMELKSPFFGIQVAGFGNTVTGDATGFQGASAFNITGGSATGWQLAGVTNMSSEYVYGLQTSALLNYTGKFITGVQLSAINFAKGDLYGIQAGVFNKNRSMNGPQSSASGGHGLQAGAINSSGRMDGYQLGLLNSAGDMTGIQFGLINISKKSKGYHFGLVNVFKEHTGWAFGLLNIGPRVSLRAWASETFQTNIGLVTGSNKISNTIFYSRNLLIPNNSSIRPLEAWGYGLSKGLLFGPHDLYRFSFIDYRVNFSWVNFKALNKQPVNVLFNPHLVYGRKLYKSYYVAVGAGLNAWWTPDIDNYKLSPLEVATLTDVSYIWKFWPGLTISFELL